MWWCMCHRRQLMPVLPAENMFGSILDMARMLLLRVSGQGVTASDMSSQCCLDDAAANHRVRLAAAGSAPSWFVR
jgi:hypothetical protein